MNFRRKFSIIIFFTFFITGLFAQVKKYTITASLFDNNKQALVGASVVLLNVKDSLLMGFANSDESGNFVIRNVKPGQVNMQITYTGFGTIQKLIEIGGENQTIDLGKIELAEDETALKEVIVKGEYIPIKIKKDTVEYNADAYRVRPNANVEELLKKLPGIEVSTDGTITAQGEEVKKVTVDGKKFFGNDPKMATQNLPADAVKKVQVIDKKSEKAEFTGISDGESEKIINLELKPEKKIGNFGEVMAGYGTSNRYESKLTLNKFTSKYQVSFIGKLNNLSDQGLSFSDYNSLTGGSGFSGGGFNMGRGGGSNNLINFGGTGLGLIKSTTAGFNAYYEFSQKFNLTASYFLLKSNQHLNKNSSRNNLLGPRSFATDKISNLINKRTGHTVNLNSQIKPDSFHRIDIEGSFRVNDANSNESLNSISREANQGNKQVQHDNNENSLKDISLRAVFNKRMRKPGRVMTVESSFGSTESDTDYEIDRITELLDDHSIDSLLENQVSEINDRNYRFLFEYKEPLGKRNYLGLTLSRRNYTSMQDKLFFTIDPLNPTVKEFNEIKSNIVDNNILYDRASLLYTKDHDLYSVNADLMYRISTISNKQKNGVLPEKAYHYLLPSFTFNWIDKNLRLRYNTDVTEPSATQLQPIINNSDPNNLYIGNPKLKPEYTHSMNIRYNFFDNFNFRNFFGFLTLRYTKDKIINSQFIDINRIMTSSPVNTAYQQSVNLNFSYSSPIKIIKSKTRIFGGGTLGESINIQNGKAIGVVSTNSRCGVELENINNKVISLLLGYEINYTQNKYESGERNDVDYINQSLRSTLLINFGKGFSLDADINSAIYSKETFGDDNTLTMFNTAFSKRMINDRLTLKIRVADVLNVGQGISRTASESYVEEATTNSIGRYAIFTLSYRLSALGAIKQDGGNRQIFMRM